VNDEIPTGGILNRTRRFHDPWMYVFCDGQRHFAPWPRASRHAACARKQLKAEIGERAALDDVFVRFSGASGDEGRLTDTAAARRVARRLGVNAR
jgi:hypothetical protein